jgi:hypothetical protein
MKMPDDPLFAFSALMATTSLLVTLALTIAAMV